MYNATEPINPLEPRIVSLTCWLEECNNLFVKLIRNPEGVGFPYAKSSETLEACVQQIVQIGDLGKILVEHPDENIWRSWEVFSDDLCINRVSCVPLFLDIDNEDQNIEDAYKLTSYCLNFLEKQEYIQGTDCLRIVFSGKKGFHIEGNPYKQVDNKSIREDLLGYLDSIGLQNYGISNYFLLGVIDPVDHKHDFIRLTGSLNSWREKGHLKRRKVIQFTFEQFRDLRTKDIIAISEPDS
jgi:hypothetical protein